MQKGRRKNAECRIRRRLEIRRSAAGSRPGGNGGDRGGRGGSGVSIQVNQDDPITSDQIKPNPTKKNGPARIKARAVGSKLSWMNLDVGRARCMQANADWMNGNANGLSDRNTFFICFTDERGSGLEENLRLSSLILSYSRLMGEKCLRPAFDFQRFELWAGCGSRGGAGECRMKPRLPLFPNHPRSRLAARFHGLNLAASCSLWRASRVKSLPTATTRQPSASQCRASASTGARMPAALPVFWMRLTASSMAARASG